MLKLERKGLVIKETDIQNQSRFLLHLTPEGEAVHKNHLKFHKEFDVLFVELTGNESETKIKMTIQLEITGFWRSQSAGIDEVRKDILDKIPSVQPTAEFVQTALQMFGVQPVKGSLHKSFRVGDDDMRPMEMIGCFLASKGIAV